MQWCDICALEDLIPGSGVCALIEGQQVALFCLPGETAVEVFAIGNYDPIGKANVLSRGIIGSIGQRTVVASPLYKQHFDLLTGECLEQADMQVPVYPVMLENGRVLLASHTSADMSAA